MDSTPRLSSLFHPHRNQADHRLPAEQRTIPSPDQTSKAKFRLPIQRAQPNPVKLQPLRSRARRNPLERDQNPTFRRPLSLPARAQINPPPLKSRTPISEKKEGWKKGDTTADLPPTTRYGRKRRRRRRGFMGTSRAARKGISLRVVALTDPLRKAKIPGFACCTSWWILVVSPSLSWLGNGRSQTRTPGGRQRTLPGRDGGDPLSADATVTPTRTSQSVAGSRS
jgi:hypothetical protein